MITRVSHLSAYPAGSDKTEHPYTYTLSAFGNQIIHVGFIEHSAKANGRNR